MPEILASLDSLVGQSQNSAPDVAERLHDRLTALIGDGGPASADVSRLVGARRGAAAFLTNRAQAYGEQARRLGNVTIAEPHLEDDVRRAFPTLPQEEVPQLLQAYQAQTQQALINGRIRRYADASRDDQGRGAGLTAISAIPGVRTGVSLHSALTVRLAAQRIRAGQGDENDFMAVGQAMGDAERDGNRSSIREIVDIIAGSVGFLGDIALTGGFGAGARAGGARLLGESLVGRLGAGAIGRAAQVAPTVAMQGTAGTAGRMIPSTDPRVPEPTLGRAAYEGYVEAAIEGLSEFASGPITRGLRAMPGVGRIFRAITPSSTGALGRVGFHGVLGEIFEERIAELGHGLTGVHRRPDGSADYGVSGNLVRGTGALLSGDRQRAAAEFGEAAHQLSIEGGAFGIMGAAGWLFAGRARGHRNLPNGPNLMTMPVLDDFADPNQVRRQRYDQAGNPLPQMTLAQQYDRASQAVAFRNQAETARWFQNVPAAELDQWVGAFGVTAENVAARREHDRLIAEAQEAGARDGQVPQELRAELAQSEQNLQETSAQLSEVMQTNLREVQTTLLDSQERPQAAQESLPTPQEAQVAPEPIQTTPEGQIQAPEAAAQVQTPTASRSTGKRTWFHSGTKFEGNRFGEFEIGTQEVPKTEAYPDGGRLVVVNDKEGQEVGRVFVRHGKGGVTTHGLITPENGPRGIARAMYDWITENVGPVSPAADQSAAGNDFWRKNQERGSNVEETPAPTTDVAEVARQPIRELSQEEWKKKILADVADPAFQQSLPEGERADAPAEAVQADVADVDPVVQAAVDMMMGEVPRGQSEAKFTANILKGLTDKQKAAVDYEWASRINANTAAFQSERAIDGSGYSFDAAIMSERMPKGSRRTDRRRGRTGQYFSPGAPTLGSTPGNAELLPISTYRIIANASVRFGVPYYIQNVYKKAEGVYAVRPQAIMMHGMAAGNAPVFMHEVAHDIDKKLNLFPNVSAVRQLPKAVQEGLFEFDYAPQEHDEGTSAAEGFGEYIRMLVTSSLPRNMSTNQRAAAAYLDERLKAEAGLWEKLEDTADDFARFVNMTPTEQAASNISVTGVAETAEIQPTLPNGQPVSEGSAAVMRDFRAKWEDDTIALQAYEAAAEARGHVFKVKPSEVVFILRSATQRAAAEMLENGVYAPQYGPTGEVIRRQQLGIGLPDVLEGLTEADKAAINGGVSRFETYFIARAIRDEVAKGRPSVGVNTQEIYARAWEEMQQDAAFLARAEPAAARFTAAFNSMIDARVVAQIITQAEGDRLKAKYPFYAPFARVPEASNWAKKLWNKVLGKGEALSTGLKARTGSDLPIMSPIKTYMARVNFLAALLAEQTKRMAVIGAFKTPGAMPGQERVGGLGGWMLEFEQPVIPHRTAVDSVQIAEMLKKMQFDAAIIEQILEMPVSETELLYFTRSPVPINGKKTIVVLEQGQPHFYRVGDQMMYDLLVGNNQIPEAAPLWLFRQANLMVKFGATAASHTFQMANIPRDVWTFARNTSDIKSAKDVPWAIIQAYSYFIYKAGGMSRADLAKYHPLMTIYLSEGGEFTRKFAFDEKGVDRRYRDLMEQHGISHIFDWGRDKASDLLAIMGAAEHAPRVTEVGNYLRQQGYTDADIAAHAEKGDVIPEYEIMKAMVAAAEVTTPFNRLGYKTRWLNLYISFFGPQVAGLSKGIRQTYANPKRVAGMAAYGLVLEILHYLANRDEEFYRNLDDYQRNRWYVFRVGNVLIRFPKSRELETLGINGFQQVLRAMDDNNPRFGGWLGDVVDQLTPPILPAGAGTALQIAMNRDWRGAPIVPRADENLPYWSRERFGRQVGYATEQLTGGAVSPARARLTPFVLTSVPSQSVQDLYAARQTLSEQRNAWGREHRIGDEADYSGFPREQEHSRINTYNRLFIAIARDRSAARGGERTAIDEVRVAMASAVMGYRDSTMPSLASIPATIRPEVEEWLGGVIRQATNPRDPDTQRRPGETIQAFRERSQRADRDRERDRATARSIIREWNLPQAEQERLLRERLRAQGYGGEAVGARLGRLRSGR